MNRFMMPFLGLLFLLPTGDRLGASLPDTRVSAAAKGLVVEEVAAGFAADQAGIQPGDVLLSWERAASPPASPEPAAGELNSPFDLDQAEIEQAPRGAFTVVGTRGDERFRIRLPPGRWRLFTRPQLTESQLVTHEQARASINHEIDASLALWRDLASSLATGGEHLKASWLFLKIADVTGRSGERRSAEEAFEQAARAAVASGETWALSMVKDSLAVYFLHQGELEHAATASREVLEIRQAGPATRLGIAEILLHLGNLAYLRGNLAAAEDNLERALTLRRQLAPRSLQVAKTLNGLGNVALERGDLASAEDFHRRALAIREELVPRSTDVAGSFNNLGNVARLRLDLAAAEDYYRRALAIYERFRPQSRYVAVALTNLGNVAWRRGDLASAEGFLRRSLNLQERLRPQSQDLAASLGNLARVAFLRGSTTQAENYLRRALAIQEQLAPRGINTAELLRALGDIALARSEPSTAEALYLRSLAIRHERAPESALMAESCQRLGALHHQHGRLDQALSFYDRAIEALEAQKGKLGGSDEVRSGFAAMVAGTYREAIALLAEVGQTEKAFHLLERYRARELLSLLAKRDLVFSSDVPEQLETRRRIANQNHDVAFEQWMKLSAEVGDEERRKAREELDTARRRQDEIRAEIRAASPRLAALQDPQPLDLDATQAVLDPGTLLLSYSIGKDSSYLFAVSPAQRSPEKGTKPTNLQVVNLATGEESLRDEVERFREVLRRGHVDRRSKKALLHASRLSELLLAPVSARIARAERLLILADGPLHSLPFAALTDPGAIDGRRFLIEAKPVHLATSATVFGLLKQERRERRQTRLIAFGDPSYPATSALNEDTEPQLRAASRNGFDLTALPATRSEVESLQRLHPRSSQVFLGTDATEARAKAVDKETTHLHIASHGLLDDRSPLDSAIALSIPAHWQKGEDNGLLQAWEIFEQVRIDADLVTLSACDTGLGKVLGGEGLMGLTRAFQYAGARSVLASLWKVNDASTGDLMTRFYGYLKEGQSKAEALRSAQLDLLRNPELSHPFHWAGFELVGDWR